MKTLSRRWQLFLLLSLVCGLALRLIFTQDMEWKEDEYYNFVQTTLIGHTRPWPWEGMNSGVYLANPGMSIWVFVWLARIARAADPIALQRALGTLSVVGIALLIPFALGFVGRGPNPQVDDREPWLWACALALVNPFMVYYQRKLWPEPFFPFFTMLAFMGWWKRDRWAGAFAWGLIGACLGQINLSGFFLAAGIFAWTVAFGARSIPRRATRWGAWVLGSTLGALPLIPWLIQVLEHPLAGPMLSGTWADIVQLKFWVFWVTDGLGLHLGNPLGLHRGGSLWDQISDFARYPLVSGHATYLCGLAHLVALGAGVWIISAGLFSRFRHLWGKKARLQWFLARKKSQGAFAESAAFWGFGILLTATQVNIRRYYMMVAFPFEQLWLVRLALDRPVGSPSIKSGRILLGVLWAMQLAISAQFVAYVHRNNGSIQGDYGPAYHVIRDEHRAKYGESWPDLKLLPAARGE